MRRGQTTLEFLMILGVALLVLLVTVTISNDQSSALSTRKSELQASLAATEIGNAAREVYAQGMGARKVTFVTLPRSYNVSLSGVYPYYIKIHVGRTDYIETFPFQVSGSLPGRPGTYEFLVENTGGNVSIGRWVAYANLSAIDATVYGGENFSESILLSSLSGSDSNVSVVCSWNYSDVSVGCPSENFTLGAHSSRALLVNFSASEEAYGAHTGLVNVSVAGSVANVSIEIPVSVLVLSSNPVASPSPSPSPAPEVTGFITFFSPTPDDGSTLVSDAVRLNASINSSSLVSALVSWNGTNTTIYNGSLVLAYNFDNASLTNYSTVSFITVVNNSLGGGNDVFTRFLMHGEETVTNVGNDGLTKLLIHGEEAVSGGAFSESSPAAKSVSVYGNAVERAVQSKFGVKSWSFSALGDYLSVPASADFNMGTGDFTVDAWVYFNSLTGPSGSYQWMIGSSNAQYFDFTYYSGDGLYVMIQQGSANLVFPWSPSTNTWYHLAVVRNNGNVMAFVNGQQIGTNQTCNYNIVNGGNMLIGSYAGAAHGFNGYLDEVRISKGVVRWTSNFIPPSAPYGNAFAESSFRSASVVAYGNAAQTDTQSKFGNNSWSFDGSGDYLSLPNSEDWNFGTGDFTIDLWARWPSTPANSVFVSQNLHDAVPYWRFGYEDGMLRFRHGNSPLVVVESAWSPSANTWYHVAVTRSGGAWRLFVNGAQLGSSVSDSSAINYYGGSSARLNLGWFDYGTLEYYFNGCLDEVRITKGIARWTSNFTPPTSPYDSSIVAAARNDSYTKLLIHGEETATANANDSYTTLLIHAEEPMNGIYFSDSSASPKNLTTYGTAAESIAQSKFGTKSWYFDSDGDYVSLPDSVDFEFGSGDFTVETWIKATPGVSAPIFWRNNYWYSFGLFIANAIGNLQCHSYNLSGTTNFIMVGSRNVSDGQWHHVACVRSGNAQYLFVDGQQDGNTGTYSGPIGDGSDQYFIGKSYSGTATLNGYLDEFRISKGLARWTANFTVPDAPYGGSTFSGSFQPVNVSAYGNAVQNSSQRQLGNKSWYFDGVSSYLAVPDSADWNFGAQDAFTIDFWAYVPNVNTWHGFVGNGDYYNQTGWSIGHTDTGGIYFLVNGAAVLVGPGSVFISNNTWNHIAVVREGPGTGQTKVYVNGRLGSQGTVASMANPGLPLSIGRWGSRWNGAMYYLVGGIDELRISKGLARWTTNFTPPFAPYDPSNVPPDVNDTFARLLINGEESLVGSSFNELSMRNATVTAYGNAAQSTAQYRFGAKSWSFDGSGDYLRLPASDDWNFSTGDFTIDFWLRPTSFTAGITVLKLGSARENTGTNLWAVRSLGGTLGFQTPTALAYGGSQVVLNTWQHCAIVKSGNQIMTYVNGILQGNASETNAIGSSSDPLFVSALIDSYGEYNGYIDELRISKGLARWTTNFTPPALPVGPYNQSAAGNDPYTVTLIHGEETLNWASFNESSFRSKNVTGTSPMQSSNQSRFGGKSIYFNGTDYLSMPNSTDLAFGTGDFTFDFWMYRLANATSGYNIVFMRCSDNNWADGWGFKHHTGYPPTQYDFFMGNYANSMSVSIPYSAWTHVAIVRSNGMVTAYVNGLASANISFPGTYDPAVTAYIGSQAGYQYQFVGYLDEFRITKGLARWTSNFTPPVAPYGLFNVTNATAVAFNYSVADVSPYGNNGTANSTWTPDGKWFGAMAFDGVDDLVSVPSSSAISPASQFTVSAWVKPESIGTNQVILKKGAIDANPINYRLMISSNGKFDFPVRTDGVNQVDRMSSTTLSAGQWYHLAGTFDSSLSGLDRVKVFINGVEESAYSYESSVGTLGTITSQDALEIGRQNNPSENRYFNGSIDEVRVWNRTLSPDEIRQQYYSNLAKFSANQWLFSSVQQGLTNNTNYTYYLYADNGVGYFSDVRSVLFVNNTSAASSPITFISPTPANASMIYVNNLTINASIQNFTQPSGVVFNWNSSNYTLYNDSLVLAMNFDDVSAIGDSARKVVDVSRYGNNGSVYGNTMLLLHMDENSSSVAYDEGVYGNNATCYNMSGGSGVTTCNWIAGKSGGGISFDGVNDYLLTNQFSVNITGDFSFGAWVKASVAQAYQARIMDLSQSGARGFQICMSPAGAYMTDNTGGPTSNILGSTGQNDGQWHHLMGTREGATYTFYIDGVYVGSSGGTAPTYSQVWLGAGFINSYFNGSIDEVLVANRSLSASEVLAQYNAGKAKHADWDQDGKWGSAIKFDGVNDYVTFGNPGSLDFQANDFTISAWVKTTGFTSGMIAAKHNTNVIGYRFVVFNAGKLGLVIRNATFSTGGVSANTPLNDGRWHFATLVRSGSTAMVYLDGALDGTFANAGANVSVSNPFVIGAVDYGSVAEFFNGSIDEVRVWNRSLSASEIQQQYYSNIAKYAPDSWLFTFTNPSVDSGNYNYYLWASNLIGSVSSELRSATFNGILFLPPTPLGASTIYINNITINASIQNTAQPSNVILSWDNANYTVYNDSLVLALNLDDIPAIGDTASKAVDVSRYGNNGTIYGNTVFLMHMEDEDSANITDESTNRNNAVFYGNTRALLHLDEASGTTAFDRSGYGNNGTCYNMNGGSGATNCNWTTGKNGSGIGFDGGNDYLDLGTGTLTSGATTISYWFNYAGSGNAYTSDLKAMQANGVFTVSSNTAQGFAVRGAGITPVASASALPGWNHVAFVYNGSSISSLSSYQVYVNGVSKSLIDSGANGVGWTRNVFGSINGGGSSGYNGSLDELMIANRSLSAPEILAQYNAGRARHADLVAGKSGYGIQFDGVDDYVDMGNAASLNLPQQFTLSGWVKVANFSSKGSIMYKGHPTVNGWPVYDLLVQLRGVDFFISSGGSYQDLFVYNILNENQWYHIAAVQDGSHRRIYINGAENISAAGVLVPGVSSDVLWVGNTDTDGKINGSIDEVAIFNRSLSSSEILAQYNAGKAKHADWAADGKWGSAMRFDGIDDYVSAGNDGSLNAVNVTVAAWVKSSASAQSSYARIVEKIYATSYYLGMDVSGNKFKGIFAAPSSPYGYLESTTTMSANTWYYVVATHDGSMDYLYVNGVRESSQANTAALSSSSPVYIGMYTAYAAGNFNGAIDEVRIWNRTLSAAEIQQQYYSNIAKYAPDKWLFSSVQPEANSTAYNYSVWASNATGWFASQVHNVTFNGIMFAPSTPANAALSYINYLTINSSIQNTAQPSSIILGLNSTNYTMYNDSLVLALNFDDVSAIGDSASKVVDISKYGNNGTIYGNTLALLHMDENSGTTAYDESRFKNNGTCYNMNGGSGVTNCNWTAGKSGSGLQFDGVDDYTNLSYGIPYFGGTAQFAVAFWVNPNPRSAGQYLVSRYNGGVVGEFYVRLLANGSIEFEREVSPYSIFSASALSSGSWSHVVASYDGSLMRLFINGAQDTSMSSGASVTGSGVPIIVGANLYTGVPVNLFNGTLDEVAIFNRPLSASEVLVQYNAGRAKHTEWTPDGKWNSALKFDGVDDYVNAGNSSSLNTNRTTVMAWVKSAVNAQTGHARIVERNYATSYYLGADVAGTRFQGIFANTSYPYGGLISTTAIAANQWYHLAITHDGVNDYLYVNGKLEITKPNTVGLDSPFNVSVGRYPASAQAHFNGSIDEVRIWNRTLSAAEIQQQYYSNVAKYAPDKWLFSSVQPEMNSTAYGYSVWATNATGSFASEVRSASFHPILFAPSTPANSAVVYANNITVNASIQNAPAPTRILLGWNSANYTLYNESLVLALNLDDVSSIGDTGRKVVDVSRYGNNGTIYGNTLALLHMDENSGTTAYDESVRANNATCYNMNGGSGVTNCNWTAGKSGYGIQFDGVDDYMLLPNNAFNSSSQGTIELWVRPQLFNGNRHAFLFSSERDGSGYLFLEIESGKLHWGFLSGSSWVPDGYGTNIASFGQWHHIAMTMNSTGWNVWLDGNLDPISYGSGTYTYFFASIVGTQVNRIGHSVYYASGARWLNGTLDEFAIHNRSLSASEIQQHYSAGKARHDNWDQNGKWGSALKFDGVNDYVSIPANPLFVFNTSNYSISQWVYVNNSSDLNSHAGLVSTYWGGNSSWFTQLSPSGSGNYGFYDGGAHFDSGVAVKYGQWSQFVVVREGPGPNQMKMYLNGINIYNFTTIVNASTCNKLYLGGLSPEQYAPSYQFKGSIDEVRVWNRSLSPAEVTQYYYSSLNKYAPDKWLFSSTQQGAGLANGTTYPYSVYASSASSTTASEPRTVQYNGAGAYGNDSYAKLLIHGEETLSGSTFTESSPSAKTVTVYGNAAESSSKSVFGTKSWYFDGSGDGIKAAASSDYDISVGTVDWWMYVTAWSGNEIPISSSDYIAGGYIQFYSSQLRFYAPGNVNTVNFGTPSAGVWHHYALVTTGTQAIAFLDGMMVGSPVAYTGKLFASATGTFDVGANSAIGYCITGYIDEVRLTKGIARWTQNFTPPDHAYN